MAAVGVLAALDGFPFEHVDPAQQELGELLLELREVMHPWAGVAVQESHEEVDVTVWAEVVAENRAEHGKLEDLVLAAKASNLLERQVEPSGWRFQDGHTEILAGSGGALPEDGLATAEPAGAAG